MIFFSPYLKALNVWRIKSPWANQLILRSRISNTLVFIKQFCHCLLFFSLTVFFYIKFRVKMFIQVDDFFCRSYFTPQKSYFSQLRQHGFTAQDWNNNLWKRILEENSTVVVEGPKILGATTDMLSISAYVISWLWRIWSRIRLIPKWSHKIWSPWTNGPQPIWDQSITDQMSRDCMDLGLNVSQPKNRVDASPFFVLFWLTWEKRIMKC